MLLLRHRLVIGLIEAITSVSRRSKALRSITFIYFYLKCINQIYRTHVLRFYNIAFNTYKIIKKNLHLFIKIFKCYFLLI